MYQELKGGGNKADGDQFWDETQKEKGGTWDKEIGSRAWGGWLKISNGGSGGGTAEVQQNKKVENRLLGIGRPRVGRGVEGKRGTKPAPSAWKV